MRWTIEVLDKADYHQLDGLPGFEAAVPPPDAMQVLVVRDPQSGTLLGYWALVLVPHAEPLWVSEALRGSAVGLALLDHMQALMQATGAERGAVVIPEDPRVEQMVQRLGCQCLGPAYLLPCVSAAADAG